jgi:hypothetical protein
MRRLLWLLLAVAGCTVPSLEDKESAPTRNECEESSECGGGRCESGRCVATRGTFSTVLFEVTPPTSSPTLAGVRFLRRVDGLPPGGGREDLLLDDVVQVSGRVKALDGPGQVPLCDWPAEVSVSLIPADRLPGLSTAPYSTKGQRAENGIYEFQIAVPSGEYDIYVQPHVEKPAEPAASPRLSCVVPQIRRREVVDQVLELQLPSPSTLDVSVVWPDMTLDGWTADIIDPNTQRVISTEALLGSNYFPEYGQYRFTLFYFPVVGGPPNELGKEVVRLRPPEGGTVLAPTIYLERSALELFVKGEAIIDQFKAFPPAVTVEAQVVNGLQPVAATVTMSATAIDAPDALDAGTFAKFSVTADSGSEGRFTAQLFPGEYTVVVVPRADSGLATSESKLVVARAPDYQAAQTFELFKAIKVDGSVLDPSGLRPVAGAAVQAIVAPSSVTIGALPQAWGEQPIVPRATTAVLDQDGAFVISADPGRYDVAVRPAEDTGFAWLVRPNQSVDNGKEPSEDLEPSVTLGVMTLPLPVIYNGRVTTPPVATAESGTSDYVPVPGALIRAYVYMSSTGYTADFAKATSVLQVAETRAAADGSFTLLLPAQLNGSAPAPAAPAP